MAKRKRTVFPKEFKLEAVRLVLDKGMSAAQVARDLGISPEYIYRWKRERKLPRQADNSNVEFPASTFFLNTVG